MSNPTFRPLDETAFDDERSLSTAHGKRISENEVYCAEERWYTSNYVVPLIGEDSSQNSYQALKPFELSAADWRCLGPFPVYCSQVTNNAKIWLTYTVSDYAMEAYAATPSHIEDDADAVTLATGSRTTEIPVSQLLAGMNLVWLVFKSGAGSATSATDVSISIGSVGDAGVSEFAIPGSTHRYVENVVIPSRLRIDARSEAVTDDVPRSMFYEIPGIANDASPTVSFDYGDLGSIRIKGVHLEFSQSVSLGQRWPWWRWYQLPSALRGAFILSGANAAHRRRMPSASWGAEPPFQRAVSGADWYQHSGFYLAGDNFQPSYTEEFRSRVYLDQDTKTNETRAVKVAFFVRFTGPPQSGVASPVDVDFRIKIDDGTNDSSEVLSLSGFTEAGTFFSSGPSAYELDRRILSAIESSDGSNERVLQETVSRNISSVDRTVWRLIEADLDASDLANGAALVTVEAIGYRNVGPWVISPILVQQIR